ncbi:VWA domain-containing protein [Candidatus Dependentiae bacterium]|nr:VWA domain-containing protein [Candidatus Dependentiae bacterium]
MNILGIYVGAWQHAWTILFVMCAAALLIYLLLWKKRVVKLLAARKWASMLIKHFSFTRVAIKSVLIIVGLTFLYFALLRPQWGKKEQKVEQHGRDLFIALDISRSMLARDVEPNRLDFAKEKIRALLRELKSERVGLILFSGSTFVQCPLTSDYGAFHLFLNQIDVETISSGTTAIDGAIKQALDAFSRVGERKHKLLVLLTDGEDFSSNLSSVKEQAAQQGMMIFALGIGTKEGAPIPLFDEKGKQVGHQKDRRGNVVISKLNEGILHALAIESGGMYMHATSDVTDISMMVRNVQNVEKEKIEEKTFSSLQEKYYWFALVSFVLLALEWLL